MTKPWYPQPRDLLTRPRARMLSLEAVGALLIAWSLSEDDGTIQPDADATARELLVFAVAQHARESADLDPEPAHTRAVRAVEELIESARVVAVGDALSLDGWVSLGGGVERSPAPAPPGDDTPDPRDRRGLSSTERSDRRRFKLRQGRYADVPAGVTYEERNGAATAATDSATARNGSAVATQRDATGCNGNGPLRNGSRAVSETSVVSDEFGEKKEEKETQTRADSRCATATATDHATAATGNDATATAVATVAADPVAESAPLDPRAREVFDAITGDKVYRRVKRVALLAEKLATAYPHHDLVTEVRKASAWAVAKGRTVKAGTFLTTWMNNADPADPRQSGTFDVPRRPAAQPAHDPWAAGLALLDAQPPKEPRRA